jgi:nickel-dependent lactate racemase
MQIIKLPQLAWYDPRDLELPFPDDWQIEICNMKGYDRPELTPEAIRAALQNPIGTKPLRELARGKKEVAILFDDLTRVTRTAKIIPHILEELSSAGIPDDNIRFICSLGMHGIMSRSDMIKKLGESVVSRYRVFNHNAFGNCTYVGTTSTYQTKVHINEEYMKCDLKIAVGSCVPHGVAGFGGGGKLVMPGIASFETVDYHHKTGGACMNPTDPTQKPTQGMGIIDHNLFRQDLTEAAGLAGIDFLINTIVNLWGESAAIYAGDWRLSFDAAVKDAKVHYRTDVTTGNDIVISNSYGKVSESMISLPLSLPLVRPTGGDIVLVANAPEGQVIHYLVGTFGKTSFACQYAQCSIPPNVTQIIVYNEYPHRGSSWFKESENTIYLSKWDAVIDALRIKHGAGTRVAVIPDATHQYFGWYD